MAIYMQKVKVEVKVKVENPKPLPFPVNFGNLTHLFELLALNQN